MIKIEHLSVRFDGPEVVRDVSFTIGDGEILGVVGESGSGKSVTALTLMGLVSESAQVTSGKIYYDDQLLLEAGKPRDDALYREYQGPKMSMVFQEPMTSLNPTMKVGAQVEEMLLLHDKKSLGESIMSTQTQKGQQANSEGVKAEKAVAEETKARYSGGLMGWREERREEKARRKNRVLEALRGVGLREAERVYDCYPHQLSGGMRQRVMIAMAVILHPGLIVADEPTTALDVTVQNQIIELLKKINQEQKNSLLFITHDLNLARRLCDRILVMQDGLIVESGPTEDIFNDPKGDYTKKLISAVPGRTGKRKSPHEKVRPLVEVRDLSVFYRENANSLFGKNVKKCVVHHADFNVYEGEILGLVGESGCGKTSLSKAILGLNKMIEGSVTHHSNSPQMVFQDPYSSLNPSKTVGWLLQEPLRAQGILDPSKAMTEKDREAAAHDMLRKVGMSEKYFTRRPSQLSGGQRQRISIGQTLITRPGLVIADEPVSALDVTIQAQILELIRSLQEELKISFLFISHDINVIYQVSDRIMVMKDGKILEIGETEEVFQHPKDAYTKELLR
ncbi:MAG: ABC transporter ATP-binding protein [Lachnospiraceae bacterium]|jgi:ABC-type glutathione transport system ATPase component|nr:ABC transporter ATP-binding protein [Lachnospiraceae bacterium]